MHGLKKVQPEGAIKPTLVARDAPTPALPQRGREKYEEPLCLKVVHRAVSSLPLWGRVGVGARVRKRSLHARTKKSSARRRDQANTGGTRCPHPGPPPEGEGGIHAAVKFDGGTQSCRLPPPLGEGWGGARSSTALRQALGLQKNTRLLRPCNMQAAVRQGKRRTHHE